MLLTTTNKFPQNIYYLERISFVWSRVFGLVILTHIMSSTPFFKSYDRKNIFQNKSFLFK